MLNEFIFPLIWVAFFAIFQNYAPVSRKVLRNGREVNEWYLVWAVIVFFPIIWIASYGKHALVFADSPNYAKSFSFMPTTWRALLNAVSATRSGRGFILLEGVIRIVFGNDARVFFAIIVLIQSMAVIYSYRHHSNDYLLSVFLFITTCHHLAWMMNGRRQFLAVAFVVISIECMIRRKYIQAVVLVLIAVTIHTSAIIMLPVIFIATGKAWNKRTLLYMMVIILFTLILYRDSSIMDIFLEGTEYEGTISTYVNEYGDDGVNPIRVLVSAVPVVLSFIAKDRLVAEDDYSMNIFVNLSIVNLGLSLVGMVTSGIMVGRLLGYTSLYNFIVLPNVLPKVFNREMQQQVKIMMVVFYMIYFWYSGGFVTYI